MVPHDEKDLLLPVSSHWRSSESWWERVCVVVAAVDKVKILNASAKDDIADDDDNNNSWCTMQLRELLLLSIENDHGAYCSENEQIVSMICQLLLSGNDRLESS
jgi:hypothetical protein